MNYSINALKSDVCKIFISYGFSKKQSIVAADCYVTADACGVRTHGLSVLKSHLERAERGQYSLTSEIEIIKSTNSFADVDANNTIGPYCAGECMKLAINKAKEEGIFTVFAKNCNTYGAAFYYTRLATLDGLIGITISNSPPAMAPWGGKDKLIGTNPLAIGIPGKNNGPILFDTATSKVAKSKINKARIDGVEIPPDWAMDIDGNPTTDPIEAIKGLVLPMAEHKGYGIAVCIDILSGMISGASYLNDVNKFYTDDGTSMNVGQTFVAIDPKIVLSESFYEMVDDYINRIHNSQPLDGQTIYYPGERKNKSYDNAVKNGIDYDSAFDKEFKSLMESCN